MMHFPKIKLNNGLQYMENKPTNLFRQCPTPSAEVASTTFNDKSTLLQQITSKCTQKTYPVSPEKIKPISHQGLLVSIKSR